MSVSGTNIAGTRITYSGPDKRFATKWNRAEALTVSQIGPILREWGYAYDLDKTPPHAATNENQLVSTDTNRMSAADSFVDKAQPGGAADPSRSEIDQMSSVDSMGPMVFAMLIALFLAFAVFSAIFGIVFCSLGVGLLFTRSTRQRASSFSRLVIEAPMFENVTRPCAKAFALTNITAAAISISARFIGC
jgi:uncharacterized membrane protein